MRTLVLLVSCCWVLASSHTGEKTHFAHAPSDWKSETIPFPLGFAPEIQLRGVEELRFAPGMYQPDAPDYFSYGFVWVLDGQVEVDLNFLTKNLVTYYKGLYAAVSKSETKATDTFYSQMETVEEGFSKASDASFSGTLAWREPFVTEDPQTLNLLVDAWHCQQKEKTVLVFLVSPQPLNHPIWGTLKTLEPHSCDAF